MTETIPFTRSQTRLLNELKQKHEQIWLRDLHGVLEVIYDELGLKDKIADGKHKLELQPGLTSVQITGPDKEPETA